MIFFLRLSQSEEGIDVTFLTGRKDVFDLVVADGSTSKTGSLILAEEITKDCYKFLGQYIAFFSITSQPEDTKLWQWYNTSRGRMTSTRPHQNPATRGAYFSIRTPSHSEKDSKIEAALDQGEEEQNSNS